MKTKDAQDIHIHTQSIDGEIDTKIP
jgi:hypothetical protein